MEGLAFSGGLAAAIGAALSGAASLAIGAPDALTWAILTASGTFIVYALDRLRDVDRDGVTSPLRTAFVVRNRKRLYAAVGLTAIGFVVALLDAPRSIVLLCIAIGGIGLLHRRLKENAALKVAYVSLAWVAACVGMPWFASGREHAGLWVGAILLGGLAANLIASNSRKPGPPPGKAFDPGNEVMVLWVARAMAFTGIVIAVAAPETLRPLLWIPACEGLALAAFQPTERYGQFAVDGGLLLGALAATAHLGMIN
jgi:4-hydroxybenzoate polyprenyltransferase